MNLNELWSGNDYAWYEWRGRGETFRPGAKRVKVIRTFKKRASYENERLSGYAEVMMVDNETGVPRTRSDGSEITTEVRARDLAMRWEAYAEEKAYRDAQRDKIAREQEERETAENTKKSLIRDRLTEKCGIPVEIIYNITEQGVHLSRRGLEEVLGIVEQHQ